MTITTDPWADLDTDFSEQPEIAGEQPEIAGEDYTPAATDFQPTYFETCKKCRGSGQFVSWGGRRLGECFACKGKGGHTRKTAPEVRAKARENTAKRAVATENQRVATAQQWAEENPTLHAWLIARADRSDFAMSLLTGVRKYGRLTDGQFNAVTRLVAEDAARDADRASERARIAASAPEITVAPLEAAFASAAASGKPARKVRLAQFVFTPAKANSANPGAIYVKTTGDDYLGKIVDGRFARAFSTPVEVEAEVLAVAADPRAAAVAYGFETGNCSCCGRFLSNPESVALGIGPICASRFGW